MITVNGTHVQMITLQAQFMHNTDIAFIFLQSSLNDSINCEAISSIHFMASRTAQLGAHYGKGKSVLMSIFSHSHTHILS